MHTVIVGGGFAGVKAALELSKRQTGRITLISSSPYLLFHASFYAAVVGRSEKHSTLLLRDIFSGNSSVEIVHDTIVKITPKKNTIKGKKHTYAYDTLILAVGSVSSSCGIPGVDRYAYMFRTIDDVSRIKKRIETLPKGDIVTIIGGGPAGVELAGIIVDTYRKHKKDSRVRVALLEESDRLLPRFSRTASGLALRRLTELGVDVRLNQQVKQVKAGHIVLNDTVFVTRTAIWTGGEKRHPIFDDHEEYFPRSSTGRVVVNSYLQVQPNIYVIGDGADTSDSGMASAALHMGLYVARHITATMEGRTLAAYKPKKACYIIPIGESWAYAERWNIYAAGRLGFIARREFELSAYRQLMSKAQALEAWRSYTTRAS